MGLIWLVGPPGAGKSTFVRTKCSFAFLELTEMLQPLTSPYSITQGIMSANQRLVELIRHVKNESSNEFPENLVVVVGCVCEEAIYPLLENEEVWLIRPDKERWLIQFTKRPLKYKNHPQFKDLEFSEKMYDQFDSWLDRPGLRLIDIEFEEKRIGKLAEEFK